MCDHVKAVSQDGKTVNVSKIPSYANGKKFSLAGAQRCVRYGSRDVDLRDGWLIGWVIGWLIVWCKCPVALLTFELGAIANSEISLLLKVQLLGDMIPCRLVNI